MNTHTLTPAVQAAHEAILARPAPVQLPPGVTVGQLLKARAARQLCLGGVSSALEALGLTERNTRTRITLARARMAGLSLPDALRVIAACVPDSDRPLRHFAADCAEMVLPIYEADCPSDDRPRRAIEAARRFADGEITQEELTAAEAAARVAAEAAARTAAWAAAQAAGAAAWTATEAAVEAAGAAARTAAAWAAGAAAWTAAEAAAAEAAAAEAAAAEAAARVAAWALLERYDGADA